MVKPKSSNRSIRLTDEMWAWLIAESDRRQTSVNGLVGDFLIVARLKAEERAVGQRTAAAKTTPFEVRFEAPPTQSELSRAPKVSIQVGPPERKPGSLQKKGK